MKDVEVQHQKAIEDLKSEHDDEVELLKLTIATMGEVTLDKTQHDELQAAHGLELDELRSELSVVAAAKDQLKVAHASQLEAYRSETRQLNDARAQMESAHAAHLSELEQSHASGIREVEIAVAREHEVARETLQAVHAEDLKRCQDELASNKLYHKKELEHALAEHLSTMRAQLQASHDTAAQVLNAKTAE